MAQAAGMTQARLSCYEVGQGLPSLKSLEQILCGLEASLWDLDRALRFLDRTSPPPSLPERRAGAAAVSFGRLGQALRLLRDHRGLSQREVAVAAELTVAMVSHYETGRKHPSLPVLFRLLEALDATLGRLAEVLDEVAGVSTGTGVAAAAEPAARPAVATSYPQQVAGEVLRLLEDMDRRYRSAGRELRELGPPAAFAERMVALVPVPSGWDERLGPLYGTRRVQTLLGGVSRQAVADRRDRKTLLGLRRADGTWVYPAFQFTARGEVLKDVAVVLSWFGDGEVDDRRLAEWLVSPLPALDGDSPIGWLCRGRDFAPVEAAAQAAFRHGDR